MNEDDKKSEAVASEDAVEIKDQDLDQASGGAAYAKMPVDEKVALDPALNLKDPLLKDPSLNFAPTKSGEAGIIGEEG